MGFGRKKPARRRIPADHPRLQHHVAKWEGLWARLALTMHMIEHAGLVARKEVRPDTALGQQGPR
jgi:hypothetical protein